MSIATTANETSGQEGGSSEAAAKMDDGPPSSSPHRRGEGGTKKPRRRTKKGGGGNCRNDDNNHCGKTPAAEDDKINSAGGPPTSLAVAAGDGARNKVRDRRPQLQKQKQHPTDPKLQQINDDPRGIDPSKRITSTAQRNGAGRNTESFNPASTLVRPDLRVWVASNRDAKFTKPLKHDDVVIIPELFGPESNWDIYYKLIEEITSLQNDNRVKGAEWISWHEGAHLISKNPRGSPTFTMVIDKLCQYFSIRKKSVGTRFNWYRDSSDWKPFHHDSA